VTDVKVAGSSWNGGSPPLGFFNFLGQIDPGAELGYSLVTNPPSVLPWTNIDTIYVEFSEDIGNFDNLDFSLGGVPVSFPPLGGPIGDYEAAGLIPPTNVSYDPIEFRATIELNEPFAGDKLLLTLFASSIDDTALNALDDGVDYSINFEVLPGDAAGGGSVTTEDTARARLNVNSVAGLTPIYDIFSDLNGDGAINTDDVGIVRSLTNSLLPLNEPVAPPEAFSGGEGFGSEEVLIKKPRLCSPDAANQLTSRQLRRDQVRFGPSERVNASSASSLPAWSLYLRRSHRIRIHNLIRFIRNRRLNPYSIDVLQLCFP